MPEIVDSVAETTANPPGDVDDCVGVKAHDFNKESKHFRGRGISPWDYASSARVDLGRMETAAYRPSVVVCASAMHFDSDGERRALE